MGRYVEEGAGDGEGGSHPHSDQDHSHRGDAGPGQHAGDGTLGDGEDPAGQDSENSEPDEDVEHHRPRGGSGEDFTEQPEERVGAHLGHDRGDEPRRRRRRVHVGVGQPAVEREHGGLDGQPDGDQDHRHGEGGVRFHRGEPRREIVHVQGSGQRVEEADAEQIERTGGGAGEQVPEGGYRCPASAGGDQGVGGE